MRALVSGCGCSGPAPCHLHHGHGSWSSWCIRAPPPGRRERSPPGTEDVEGWPREGYQPFVSHNSTSDNDNHTVGLLGATYWC